jgi:hypothetical protein
MPKAIMAEIQPPCLIMLQTILEESKDALMVGALATDFEFAESVSSDLIPRMKGSLQLFCGFPLLSTTMFLVCKAGP